MEEVYVMNLFDIAWSGGTQTSVLEFILQGEVNGYHILNATNPYTNQVIMRKPHTNLCRNNLLSWFVGV